MCDGLVKTLVLMSLGLLPGGMACRCDYVLYRGSVTGMKTTVVGRIQNEGDAAKQIAPSDHMAVVATVHLGAEAS
jgi:hypothetical protein